MEWEEYINQLLTKETELDETTITYKGEDSLLSPIVKASTLMLQEISSTQGDKNVFVFPETKTVSMEFLISSVIHTISGDKNNTHYDPHSFVKGQKMRFMNCIVEFIGCETNGGKEYICFKLKDLDKMLVPVEKAPFFQNVESKRLSKLSQYRKAQEENKDIEKDAFTSLAKYKTHLNGSTFFVSEIKTTRDYLTSAKTNDREINKSLYFAHANGDGELSNLTAGQMTGNPAVIICSDLYSVENAISYGAVPKQIIIDIPNTTAIENQLDVLDSLLNQNIQITCITNTSYSFDLEPLIDRHFNIWRWNEISLTDSLCKKNAKNADRIRNCLKHNIKYKSVSEKEISKAFELLSKHKDRIDDESSILQTLFEKVLSVEFVALRNALPYSEYAYAKYNKILEECYSELENEKKYIAADLYDDLSSAIVLVLNVFSEQYVNNKTEELKKILKKSHGDVCLVIPDKIDKSEYELFWKAWINDEDIDNLKVEVLHPQEYINQANPCFNSTIVPGWLGNNIMRKILYSYNSKEYIVMTYDCENRWKTSHTRRWNRSLNISDNKRIIKNSLASKKHSIDVSKFEQTKPEVYEDNEKDELLDIENLINKYKYKKYGFSSGAITEPVSAIPISFVGDYILFCRTGHSIISASEIIQGTGDKIKTVLPERLRTGDFVVFRESQRDIIREIADHILEDENAIEARNLSQKWKESLNVESAFSSSEEIFDKLKKAGCKRDFPTIKNWLTNEEIITPKDKEDLINIAAATNDEILLEKIDDIFAAGQIVKAAHIRAGKILSDRLKEQIALYVQDLSSLDALNIWEPIEIQINEIGTVKILKIIDINPAIQIDISNTNKLIVEQ